MLAQYPLHNNETLSYMEHGLYRLDKTKIAYKNHCPINVKLFRPTFNYPKFHAMTHFVQCIWDYSSTINHDMAYSKASHKYFFKAFYKRIKKKEYKLQILKHNICYANVITIQDVILIAKVPVESAKKRSMLLICLMKRLQGYAVQQMFS